MLPKFGADRSQVRGVNGRSKFVVAAVAYEKIEKYQARKVLVKSITGVMVRACFCLCMIRVGDGLCGACAVSAYRFLVSMISMIWFRLA